LGSIFAGVESPGPVAHAFTILYGFGFIVVGLTFTLGVFYFEARRDYLRWRRARDEKRERFDVLQWRA
jgi:hypothetical protein